MITRLSLGGVNAARPLIPFPCIASPSPPAKIVSMRFSLKTLALATAVIPPIVWLVWAMLWRSADEELKLPDPLGTLAVIAWIAIYYYCVHKRLPASARDN